ncbi:MAG: Rieske (2Fe-2S) protein [Acidobacteria bacterium]|nr:Rieske (2Fe-2S) protein [Acidobacteriota bacterium]
MADFVTLAKTGDIPDGQGRVFEANGRQIAVFHLKGEYYALDNICAHRGGPLGEGSLSATAVTCPWHGWTYDVTTGECTFNPNIRIQTFPVRVEGENLQVAL